jgi:hypothetical protein
VIPHQLFCETALGIAFAILVVPNGNPSFGKCKSGTSKVLFAPAVRAILGIVLEFVLVRFQLALDSRSSEGSYVGSNPASRTIYHFFVRSPISCPFLFRLGKMYEEPLKLGK